MRGDRFAIIPYRNLKVPADKKDGDDFRAWEDENRGRPRFSRKDENRGRARFSVGKELANHPRKAKLVKKHPNMTEREAH